MGALHGGQFNEGSRTIAWRIDRMAAGETCVVKSKLVPKATGTQTSTVRVPSPTGSRRKRHRKPSSKVSPR